MDLSKIRSRAEAESLIMEKISSEKTRGFILKNLQRNPGDIFSWKLNASSLYKNLDKIMAGIDLEAGLSEPITGFPVIFLKGAIPESIFHNDCRYQKSISGSRVYC